MNIDKTDIPTPRINLSTCDDVRLEMSRVYRDARLGSIMASDGTKLVFILSQILRAFEIIDFDKRLKSVERASGNVIKL
jgi:hypothetical protein